MLLVTSVICISQRRSHLTPAKTSMVLTSHSTILATITHTRVPTTTLAVSVIQTCYVPRFHVTPVTCMAATTNQQQAGKCTKYTGQ